jgi:hypothetical protein
VWGSGGIAPLFLTSVLDGGEWSASLYGPFIPKERASSTHWIGGSVGLSSRMDGEKTKKILPLPGNQIPSIERIAHLYTDWAIHRYLKASMLALSHSSRLNSRGDIPSAPRVRNEANWRSTELEGCNCQSLSIDMFFTNFEEQSDLTMPPVKRQKWAQRLELICIY